MILNNPYFDFDDDYDDGTLGRKRRRVVAAVVAAAAAPKTQEQIYAEQAATYQAPSDTTGTNKAVDLPYEQQTVTEDAYTKYGTGLKYDPLDFRIQEDKYEGSGIPLQPLDGLQENGYGGVIAIALLFLILKG